MLKSPRREIRGSVRGEENVESAIASEFFVSNFELKRIDCCVMRPVCFSAEQVHSHRCANMVQESRNIILNVGLIEKPRETFEIV